MLRSVSDIVSDVRMCIDELGLDESQFVGGTEDAELEAVIESKIEDALRYVSLNGGLDVLEFAWMSGTASGVNVKHVDIPLPANLLRLCVVNVDGWPPMYKAIRGEDKEYMMLKNPITTGYSDNPKMAIVKRQYTPSVSPAAEITPNPDSGVTDIPTVDGGATITPISSTQNVLELYGYPDKVYTPYQVAYMPEPSKVDDKYDIPTKAYRGVVYYTAGLTLLTYKDAHADALMNQAIQIIGAKIN